MTRKLILLVAVALMISACYTTKEWRANHFRTNGLPRVTYELDCPESQLKITDISPPDEMVGSTMGVEGCGKRATYVLVSGHGWMNNTAGTEE